MRRWLREWLGIESLSRAVGIQSNTIGELNQNFIKLGQSVAEARIAVAELKVAQYVPPAQKEPEKKVYQARTWKEYNDIMEREFAEREASNAVG